MTTPSQDASGQMGRAFVWIAWLLALGLLTLFFNGLLDHQRNPNQALHSQIDVHGVREVTLQRNRFGHYLASGSINGQRVEFLLDTGASDVSIPAVLAHRLGLQPGAARVYLTANGPITAYATRLDELRIGDIVLHDVRASINPAAEDIGILLGMSALKQLEFTQRGNTLILRQYP
jgi:aspartyl protease family protein